MNLPKDFENYFLSRWKEEDVATLLQGLDAEPSVSIRLNTRRLPADSLPAGADGRVPWCPEGIYLRQRPSFTADPLFHAGAYYVQEASSMFLAHVVRSLFSPTSEGMDTSEIAPLSCALDLCAAPGGKSTLLRSLLPDDCLLVSNEPNRARCQVLAENLAKWGHPNVLVTQAYPKQLSAAPPFLSTLPTGGCPLNINHSLPNREGEGWVSLILADVPCSGEGMMRREEEAVRQWSPAFVADCAAHQRSIVADIWPALVPGGILIYSTCTFNPEEDEDNVEWIASHLGADLLSIPIDPAWHIRGDLRRSSPFKFPCYHFLPGLVRGEGFFLAVLRKHGNAPSASPSAPAAEPDGSPSGHRRLKKKERRAATLSPRTTSSSLPVLPTNQLDTPNAPHVELSLDDAVRYLQREALILPPNTPRGIVQACFRGQRLGLMNNLGTRANNLYPKEWRIRSGHITPQTLFDITTLKQP